jgi:hypothetical protein
MNYERNMYIKINSIRNCQAGCFLSGGFEIIRAVCLPYVSCRSSDEECQIDSDSISAQRVTSHPFPRLLVDLTG